MSSRRKRRAPSGFMALSGNAPLIVTRAEGTAPMDSLQDAWNYLWFVCRDISGAPDVAWGYDDEWMCRELASKGPRSFLLENVYRRVPPWYWLSATNAASDLDIRRSSFHEEVMRSSGAELASMLANAVGRINNGVASPFRTMVFGTAQLGNGFHVPYVSTYKNSEDREHCIMQWHDWMNFLGPREGPALVLHQIVEAAAESIHYEDAGDLEALASLIVQGAFDSWTTTDLSDDVVDTLPALPAMKGLERYIDATPARAARIASLIESVGPALHSMIHAIHRDAKGYTVFGNTMRFIQTVANSAIYRDRLPDFSRRGLARSCRSRLGTDPFRIG